MIMWSSLLELVFAHTFFTALTSHSNHTSTEFESTGSTEHPSMTNSSSFFEPTTYDETRAKDSPQVCNGCDENLLQYCGENMRCYCTSSESRIGECDCDHSSLRVLLYHNATNRCYEIFKQGPCKEVHEWFDVAGGTDKEPSCQNNPCYNSSGSGERGKDMVQLKNGTCVEVGGHCGDGNNGRWGFKRGRRLPSCIHLDINLIRTIGVIPYKRCSPGTYRTMNGVCQPSFKFDYD